MRTAKVKKTNEQKDVDTKRKKKKTTKKIKGSSKCEQMSLVSNVHHVQCGPDGAGMSRLHRGMQFALGK